MPEPAGRVHAAVVKVGDGVRVDARGKGEGRADQAVFAFGDEVGLPFEALNLPGAEEEGGYGDDGWRGGVLAGRRETERVGGRFVPRMIRPGPCLRPVRTSSGGLSRIEVKPGSSAACFAGRRGVLEMGRLGGRRAAEGLTWAHFVNVEPIGCF